MLDPHTTPEDAEPATVSHGFATVLLADPAATNALGTRIAEALAGGGTVLLSGDLGAGKSALARAIIRTTTGDPEREVPSPSYTLVNRHDSGGREIWHADLYRLSGPDEVAELGLEEAVPGALLLVEWPDRMDARQTDRLPAPRLNVLLTPTVAGSDTDGRTARLESDDLARASLARIAVISGGTA